MPESPHQSLASKLAAGYETFPQVEAVALGGSQTSGADTDAASDIDLYVFVTTPIALEDRLALVEQVGGASRANMNLSYWDVGDEWFHAGTGIEVDVMYWDPRWMEGMLEQVIRQHRPSLGYTTAHWHTIRAAQPLFDRRAWFAGLQELSRQPYPEPLRLAVIEHNLPLLRDLIPSYLHQIEKAVRRGDLVSVNHRLAAFLASYFDIVFAENKVLHPGEKRLLDSALRLCSRLPDRMAEDVTAALQSAGSGDDALVGYLHRLVDRLEEMLRQ